MTNLANKSDTTILVVEDDELIRSTALAFLEDTGLPIIEADTADAALAILQNHASDVRLIFTDVQMPGTLNGIELAFHAHVHWPHIRLIITSGQVHPLPGQIPPPARFLRKPYRAHELLGHVSELLS